MKVTVRKMEDGNYAVYVPKKDLEEPVLSMDRPDLWGGTISLRGGMRLELPEMPPDTKLPITIEARRVD